MKDRSRREFLGDISRGMLITGLGAGLAAELGIHMAKGEEAGTDLLPFGKLRPMVGLLQETPIAKLQPLLVKKLKDGSTNLKELVAATALANAETFGGQDYVGYHTEMALMPAWQMANELPSERQALPILKVIHRNSQRIHESGRSKKKALHPVEGAPISKSAEGGEVLREATRAGKLNQAEGIFAGLAEDNLKEAYNDLLWSVQDNGNVHRFVLAHRSWALIDVVGKEHAHTMLRQSVRYCADEDGAQLKRNRPEPPIRKDITHALDEHKLLGRELGKKDPGDAWVDKLCTTIYQGNSRQATGAIAEALADGVSPEVIGEAISLAANQLVLRQDKSGRSGWRTHGDSPGVHACDAVNAWRNMVRVSDHRNLVVGLMVAGHYIARGFPYKQGAYPHAEHRQEVKDRSAKGLLRETEEAIRSNEQGVASAAIQIYGEQGYPLRPALDLLLRYAISEDGRLHSEKFYRTVVEEHATTREAFRWRHMTALARVTASAYGYTRDDKAGQRAPGYEEACRLLNVKA